MIQTRREILLVAVALLVGPGLLGAQMAEPVAPAEEAPRIQAEELKKLVDKGEAVIVDVRHKSAWDMGHIEGALHIPLTELPGRLKELPKDKLIACYCT